MSAKEDCFKEATEKYEEATGQSLGIEHQRPWRQLFNGTWERATSWQSAINSYVRGNAAQFRVPDVTINGNTVVDLKFTRADGTVDTWGTRPGQGNGNLQRDDYNDINGQNNPEFDNQNPKLDPETCNCGGGSPSPVTVPVWALDPFGAGEYVAVPMNQSHLRGVAAAGAGIQGAVGVIRGMGMRPMTMGGVRLRVSSEQYKKDVAPADLRAERLLDVDIKSFNWRRDGRPDVGFIAEEIAQAVPELFHKDANFTGIQASQLPFYLLDLIKQQQTQIAKLTQRLDALTPPLAEDDAP